VAGVIAVVASRGGDGPSATTSTNSKTTGSTTDTAEIRPVRVSGTPLPRYGDDPDPAVGKVIPEIHGAGFDATAVDIVADGRPKLIVFVAHWCPHCQREVPRLSDYLEAHPIPASMDMVTVATGTSPDRPNYPPSAWLEREGWPGPVMADSDRSTAADALGLSAYPFFVAVDASGEVVARTSGELQTADFRHLLALATGGAA
jgi:cytochrome c biogenesis protein CcmG/thiol:disulfide interchange protein DsbE